MLVYIRSDYDWTKALRGWLYYLVNNGGHSLFLPSPKIEPSCPSDGCFWLQVNAPLSAATAKRHSQARIL